MNKETTQNPPRESLICTDSGSELLNHCQTLENTTQVLELLEYLDLSEGITKDAEYGVFLTLETVINALRYVSAQLNTAYQLEISHAK